MNAKNTDAAEIFGHLVKTCDRKAVLELCEGHIYEEETDEELAEFIEDTCSARPGVESLIRESEGGEEYE